MSPSNHQVFGIRHHGPGSARALVRALEQWAPDCILIEGPADADELIPWVADPAMVPPVSLLGYIPDSPQLASFYPFAVFSPEWQALRYGLSRGLPVRFMDLPLSHQLAQRQKDSQNSDAEPGENNEPTLPRSSTDEPEADTSIDPPPCPTADIPSEESETQSSPGAHLVVQRDPLHWLAQAAGHEDSERWWDEMVESRLDGQDLFAAIAVAMSALRLEVERDTPRNPREDLREAFMRRTIRQATKEGYQRIAVVCGAWHLPALMDLPPAKQDDALLKGLPKTKVALTWVPTTYGRLAMESGYGAGVEAPGWYDYLWQVRQSQASPSDLAVGWMVRVGRSLRDEDLEASSASIIETVRLAEALAAIRQRPLPGLPEFAEATQTVLCMGLTTPLELIRRRLLIDDRLGQVPEGVGSVALEQDIQKLMKRFRLQRTADTKTITLDLRKENDLERSTFLHRLLLLGIRWGAQDAATTSRGTFKEVWTLQWQPELALAVIEASLWGTTVETAALQWANDQARKAQHLPELTALIGQVMLADLEDAVPEVLQKIAARSAVAGDTFELMAALPSLARVQRYGSIRPTSLTLIEPVVLGLMDRVCIGLTAACASLDDDAARLARSHLLAIAQETIPLLSDEDRKNTWNQTVLKLLKMTGLHGLVAGTCARLVLDQRLIPPEQFQQVISLALSRGGDLAMAAAWIEGFLSHSGTVLVHDPQLFQIIDDWLTDQPDEAFVSLLPVVRRTFSTFELLDRQRLMSQVRLASTSRISTGDQTSTGTPGTGPVLSNQAHQAITTALMLLGIQDKSP